MKQFIAKCTQLVFSFVTYVILKIFFGFEVRGKENIVNFKNKPVIFAGNHNSRKFDGFITGTAIALADNNFYFGELSPVRYLAFKSYFKWFRFETPLPFPISILAALWLRLNNCIPVKNRRREEYKNLPLKSLLAEAIIALKNGESLFIFPEGKTGGDDKLRKGKRGVACLHRETGVPIIPVVIQGSYKMFSLNNLLKPRNDKKVIVNFGKPIYNLWEGKDDREKKSLIEGVDKVMGCVARLISVEQRVVDQHRGFLIKYTYLIIKKLAAPVIKKIWISKVEGVENIPKKGPFIVASNHESYFDFLCFTAVSSRNIHYLAAEVFFEKKYWRTVMKASGQIKVDRQSKDKKQVHDRVFAKLEDGHVVGIFPEGTRSRDGKMLKAFPGVAKYALKAKVPILPVGVIGTRDIMTPYDQKPKFNKKAKIKIGEPLNFDQYFEADYTKELLESITDTIMLKIADLAEKEYPYAKNKK